MKNFGAIFAALISFYCTCAMGQDAKEVTEAKTAASAWLALVDAGNYAGSWEQAASPFRGELSQATWETMAQRMRTPLGSLKSREVQSATFTHTLPDAPDGDYVVITYVSKFENKADAVESVTPMRDKDGLWHVSDYFAK